MNEGKRPKHAGHLGPEDLGGETRGSVLNLSLYKLSPASSTLLKKASPHHGAATTMFHCWDYVSMAIFHNRMTAAYFFKHLSGPLFTLGVLKVCWILFLGVD